MKLSVFIGILLASLFTVSSGKIWEIDIPTSLQECYDKVKHVDISTFVGSTYSWLCESALNVNQMNGPQKIDAPSYIQHLTDKIRKSQACQNQCVRREYRTLSDTERKNFHKAVNALKDDTSVEPNKYDAIASFHGPEIYHTAHWGAGFPGWHRIYLLIFETALREVDNSVCLPYWDSSLDAELGDLDKPSPVWNKEFFGSHEEEVTKGPFANWTYSKGPLKRNVGSAGDYFLTTDVENILTGRRHADILRTDKHTNPLYDFELYHGRVHEYVGGAMENPTTAAFDPIFFMHHAFIDYVWDLFRTNLRDLGVDPEVYPEVSDTLPHHHGTAQTGFGNMTQADGYCESLKKSYKYEHSPLCSDSSSECGSKYLTCNNKTGNKNIKRCVPNTNIDPEPTQNKRYGNAVQNDFCLDNGCDSDQWVTIPVKIVNVRPPKFSTYSSYPVKNGTVMKNNDIYSPSAYNQTDRYITEREAKPKTYERCREDDIVGKVFISSRGMNYNGFFKEAAIVDNRLAVSVSIGFVNIKKPSSGSLGVSKALIRAYDSCGRVCHPACNDSTTGDLKKCSGAVAVSNEAPLMYGDTYGEAVMDIFDFKSNKNFPAFKSDNFFITFYCDYHKHFPYANYHQGDNLPGSYRNNDRGEHQSHSLP